MAFLRMRLVSARRLVLFIVMLGACLVAGLSLHTNAGAADCQPSAAPECDYPSGDTLRIPSLNTGDPSRCGTTKVSAPVNVYDVGSDSALGVPIADCDVVRENLAAFPGYGGYPTIGGTTVLAGHVDYHPNYQAVFWNLRSIQIGATIEYARADGTTITFAVDWAKSISDPNYDWPALFASSATQTLVLITCNGTFNPTTHDYDQRFVVHAYRTN